MDRQAGVRRLSPQLRDSVQLQPMVGEALLRQRIVKGVGLYEKAFCVSVPVPIPFRPPLCGHPLATGGAHLLHRLRPQPCAMSFICVSNCVQEVLKQKRAGGSTINGELAVKHLAAMRHGTTSLPFAVSSSSALLTCVLTIATVTGECEGSQGPQH